MSTVSKVQPSDGLSQITEEKKEQGTESLAVGDLKKSVFGTP
tara:strand:+ start:202 stop:327 length:126 start_codon:yes stop_codon:yes gene_type:complete